MTQNSYMISRVEGPPPRNRKATFVVRYSIFSILCLPPRSLRFLLILLLLFPFSSARSEDPKSAVLHYLYVAAPGIRNDLEFGGAHNTVCSLDDRRVYMAGLRSPLLTVLDAQTQKPVGQVGPFSAAIRPFTINGARTLCIVNVNGLLGFEIGDLNTGKKLYRVEVQGFKPGPTKRHGCPSHGVGMTPDEKEIWVCDAANSRLHVFDATVMPPRQMTSSITLREQPGWITFSLDGRFAFPSTGEIIDAKTKKIVAALRDEQGREVHSEKMLEIDFENGVPVRAGDQFGLGRVVK